MTNKRTRSRYSEASVIRIMRFNVDYIVFRLACNSFFDMGLIPKASPYLYILDFCRPTRYPISRKGFK